MADTTANTTETSCIFSGWLKKTGGVLSMQKLDRWVELSGQELVRYKKRGGAPNGTILLDANVKITRSEDCKGFALVVGGHKFVFRAATEELREEWLKHISDACAATIDAVCGDELAENTSPCAGEREEATNCQDDAFLLSQENKHVETPDNFGDVGDDEDSSSDEREANSGPSEIAKAIVGIAVERAAAGHMQFAGKSEQDGNENDVSTMQEPLPCTESAPKVAEAIIRTQSPAFGGC